LCCRLRGIERNCFRIGMCGVDQKINAVGKQVIRKACGAAKTADAHGNTLFGRGYRSARQRNRRDKRPPCKRRGKLAGLRSTAKNQDVGLHVRQH